MTALRGGDGVLMYKMIVCDASHTAAALIYSASPKLYKKTPSICKRTRQTKLKTRSAQKKSGLMKEHIHN